jgi:acyl-CoA synthetase (AMP-forming)/AMP-acid ligase II
VAFSWRSPATAAEEIVTVAEVQHGDDPGRSALPDWVAQSVSAALGAVVDRVVLVGRGGVPRTTSGKLRRRECRRRFEDGRLATPPTAGVTSEGTDRR